VTPNWKGLRDIALDCERLNYDSVWIMDHFTYHGLPAVMESYTTLGALAAVTSKIRIGSLVTCNSYRSPAVLAKMVATLDVISNGRIEFGIGAGWKKDEYEMYGFDFPTSTKRIEMLQEATRLIKRIWTDEKVNFHGKYYHVENMDFGPRLIQRPHPPIWIGGKGDRLLQVVAELADYSNIYDVTRNEYHDKMELLKKRCADAGRDYRQIRKSLDLEVIIGKTEDEVRRKLKHAYEHQHFDSVSLMKKIPLEDYVKKRLIGTPEKCISQMQDWLVEDVDYVLVGWTMGLEDWVLFSEEIIPAVS